MAVLIGAVQNLDAGWRHTILGWLFREMSPKNVFLRVDIVKIRASIRLPHSLEIKTGVSLVIHRQF